MDCQATSFVSVTQCDPTSGTDPICLARYGRLTTSDAPPS